MLLSVIFFILFFFGLISALLVIVSVNPVNSIFFLGFSFLIFSILLFLLGLEFIPIIFIIVYVGAITVLFLFIIMMLDIKIAHKNNDFYKFLPILTLFLIAVFVTLNQKLNLIFLSLLNFDNFYGNWFICINNIDNIEFLGAVFFIDYYIYILLSGIILLLSLIGSITLTLQFDKNLNYQIINKQIARDLNLAVFFIK
jgi:NADH-quinone oxidoreductase subunit J